MRKIFLQIGLFMLCVVYTSYAANNPEEQLKQFVQENNFFRVRELLAKAKGKIAPEKLLYYQALVENRFDECEASNHHIKKLLSRYKSRLNDSLVVELLGTKVSNNIRLCQYKQVAGTCSEILTRYAGQLDSAGMKSWQNTLDLFGVLADVPPQQMIIAEDETIAAYRNKFNHLMVPVKTNGIPADFIFDSGANLSTISEGYAKKMNLKIMESAIKVGSATTIDVKSKLAVADSIFVGGILFRNVVFLVLPDEKLSFPQVNLVINGIIGFPVIYQMGEIHMQKDGAITVPKTAQRRSLNNLFLDDLVPVVAVCTNNDTLLLNMDTGAKTTELSKKYYDNHKQAVNSTGTKTKKYFGGAGGITEMEMYELPDFSFTIGSRQASLPKVPVILSGRSFTKNRDGNLGQDVITQFDRMILSFRYMYVDFEMNK